MSNSNPSDGDHDDQRLTPPSDYSLDPDFQAGIERLHELTVLGRWALAIGLWLTVGLASLWSIRQQIGVLTEYFTWSGLRYTLIFNRFSTIGLYLCIGMTVSVLVWQSRNILWGRSAYEQDRLHQQLLKIHQQGESHPLWNWVHQKSR
jgi:hypothetical protein